MSVDSAGMAARLGIKPGMVVQELGWDEDADEDLRDASSTSRAARWSTRTPMRWPTSSSCGGARTTAISSTP